LAKLGRNPGTVRMMSAGLARRTNTLMLDVEGYTLNTGKQGIIGYLLNQLEHGEPGSEAVSLDLAVTKCVIASRLNLTQEHFSRILHELSGLGLIVVEGKKIHIPNVAKLRKHES